MSKHVLTSDELMGVRVLGGKKGRRRLGKVRRFVFHPKENRLVGFLVKRPDLLWMFHRKDIFVSLKGYDVLDGRIVIRNKAEATNKGACQDLGLTWDSCVLWIGLPVMTREGEVLGKVGCVEFDKNTGVVQKLITDGGSTANMLLGQREISGSLVKGFRQGQGAELATTGQESYKSEETVRGAILVDSQAEQVPSEGGLAEKAGGATAVVVDKAHTAVDKAKPVVSNVAKITGKAVNKGAYATGKQIAASKGMFSNFKEEYNKAREPLSLKPQSSSALVEKSMVDKKPGTKKPAAKKNMFAGFKEEFNRARRNK